ncbi:MAG: NmrA family NAD(P)-binding protein [Chloroflexota bacterium]
MLQTLNKPVHYQNQSAAVRPKSVAVVGATGTIGSEVMRQLAQTPNYVTGILRNANRPLPVPIQEYPARVGYVAVDHDAADQLTQAFEGHDALFLLMGNHPQQVESETRVIEAAKRGGVKRIVKLSAPFIPKEVMHVQVADWHREIEAALDASGMAYVALRPLSFMQNWLRNTATIQHLGMIFGSAGDAPKNYTDGRDVAAIATRLLLSNERLPSTTLSIRGPDAISNQEMADRISAVTGRTIRYQNLSKEAHREMLVKRAKLPAWLVNHILELEELAILIPETPSAMVESFLGQPPRRMNPFLQEHRAAFLPSKQPLRSAVSSLFSSFLA